MADVSSSGDNSPPPKVSEPEIRLHSMAVVTQSLVPMHSNNTDLKTPVPLMASELVQRR